MHMSFRLALKSAANGRSVISSLYLSDKAPIPRAVGAMNTIPRFSAAARQSAQASTSARPKQCKDEARVRHKGVLKGLEEAQALHKPKGWSRSLQDFKDQPYQGRVTSKSVESQQAKQGAEMPYTEDLGSTAVPRKGGVTDGPWDQQDNDAMVEALTDGRSKSTGMASRHSQMQD